jgi:hypothetical protein
VALVLPEFGWPSSILGLEQEHLQLVSYVSLDPEKTIDPLQNNAERLGLAHVLLALDKSVKQPVRLASRIQPKGPTVQAWAIRFRAPHTCRQLGKSRHHSPVPVSIV